MPVWEDEAPIENREFDQRQNDSDFYHENEYYSEEENVIFWESIEDVQLSEKTKFFFFEQLKILTKYIKEANTKIQTNREIFKREIKQWNELYDKQFISKTSDLSDCSSKRTEQLKLLYQKAKCNHWGNWRRINDCPICGDGHRQEERDCFTHDNSGYLK